MTKLLIWNLTYSHKKAPPLRGYVNLNSPIIRMQESKVDVQSYVLISLSVHWHICFDVTH